MLRALMVEQCRKTGEDFPDALRDHFHDVRDWLRS